jgi:FAD/FMN-containing dehydrogenase
MIANNAAGIRACKYGSTKDWILGLEVVLPSGEVIKTGGRTLKASSGYDLTRLFTSSEGTLGVITEAIIKIHPLPECVVLIVPSFNNVEDATEAMGMTFKRGIIPATMELISGDYIKAMNQTLKEDEKLPVAEVVLLIDVDGNKTAVTEEIDRIVNICKMCKAVEVKVVENLAIRKRIWHARHYAAFVISRVLPPPEKIKLWATHFVDIGVPLSKVPAIIEYLKEISAKYGVTLIPFGHIADGNVHVSWWADPRDKEELKKARDIGLDLLRKAKDLGGTISAEHGIGILRAPYMNLEHPTGLNLMRQLKKLIDPDGIMNPGKLALEDIPEDLFVRLMRELYPESGEA